MKLEPMAGSEAALEHHGKRGLSWHGAAVYIPRQEPALVGSLRDLHYVDQILDMRSKQSTVVVASCLESLLKTLTTLLPSLETVALQCDNAKNYSNEMLPLLLLQLTS
eukprot:Plantae.Rhodophyta-Hildenbrandia_rubra.ctg78155.p1 GENE.Plantae.Rhodophyta-Hildenbrandia_rubra.ctg78155~~Plantae.Rhodophyta-Hildenbrandia_rubra.ctg78155.p1  ORF type:complete len:108 (-),score=11.73 Plantae.Rhodophyta-Hildenbrandia_rubra.ctg78155:58-381(-)